MAPGGWRFLRSEGEGALGGPKASVLDGYGDAVGQTPRFLSKASYDAFSFLQAGPPISGGSAGNTRWRSPAHASRSVSFLDSYHWRAILPNANAACFFPW